MSIKSQFKKVKQKIAVKKEGLAAMQDLLSSV